jgi:pimeloyl-ACP methyl ester carboxylesterase
VNEPLLYQLATGALSPGEIAYPLRGILAGQDNARVVLADVAAIDLPARRVLLRGQAGGAGPAELTYDSLVVAAGAAHCYFGHEAWASHAPGLKTIEDAWEIRRRILTAFEAAEIESCPERCRAWLTFAVVGGGPTGVELAGQIAEIARDTRRREFRSVDPTEARILLIASAVHDAELVTIQGAGHAVILERPEEINEAIASLAAKALAHQAERQERTRQRHHVHRRDTRQPVTGRHTPDNKDGARHAAA